jgi:hypothetical protein
MSGQGRKNEKCRSGKVRYRSYGAALEALNRLIERGIVDPLKGGGTIYQCTQCGGGAYHISKRQCTVSKTRGRGRSRRGVVW